MFLENANALKKMEIFVRNSWAIPILFFSFISEPTVAAECLPYEPALVVLHGKIESSESYGSPGYGENPEKDATESYYFIKLVEPICTQGSSDDPENQQSEDDIDEIQIIWNNAGKFKGENVNISGTLFHQITGHHHTKVLINVRELRK